ncbi:META domain-containing protein [Hydrogenimonas sp.]
MYGKIFFTLSVLLAMVGCSGQPTLPKESAKHELTGIEGKRWQLVSFGNHRTKVPRKAWMRLEEGRYRGFAGCNGLSGTYEREGRTIRFTMDPSTQMACPDMKGETMFRTRLLEVDRFGMEEGLLVLTKEGEKRLVFMEKEQR